MKNDLPVSIEFHTFSPADFVGGDPALDFANTVAGWNNTPRDWLDGYDRLADWARETGVVSAESAAALKRAAGEQPTAAKAALDAARALREDIHDYFSAIAAGRAPENDVVERLFSCWRTAADRHAPRLQGGRIVLEPAGDVNRLELIADRLAYVAFELAQEVDPQRLRLCDGDNCGWLFIDTSKAGRRRWCDMATCGNAAKSKRHQARKGGG